jgi:hypothetical protein
MTLMFYMMVKTSEEHSLFATTHFFNAAFTLGTSSSFSRMSGNGPIGVI